MVMISKHVFNETCQNVDCHLLLHCYGRSCWQSLPETFKQTAIGSAKFYIIVYLLQILSRGKKMKKKNEWIKMANAFIRTTIMGTFIGLTSSCFGCVFRWLLGNKFNYYTYLWIPNMLNGLFIFMEPPSRRGLIINLFSSLMIEYLLNTLSRAGHLTLTKSKQTLMFMVGSALLFYLMRLEGDKEKRTHLFWIYTAEKVKRKTDDSPNPCPHDGSCSKYIAQGSATYFSVGLAMSMARLLLPKIRTPLQALSSINSKNFKLALFFGSYVGIFRAVVCYLCRKQGVDSALYALPAGYLAGLSFMFSPSLGISIASLTAALKLYSTILYEKKLLPTSIPLPELLYCFCQGTLVHARFMHADVCPSYVINLLRTATNGISEQVYTNLLKEISKSA